MPSRAVVRLARAFEEGGTRAVWRPRPGPRPGSSRLRLGTSRVRAAIPLSGHTVVTTSAAGRVPGIAGAPTQIADLQERHRWNVRTIAASCGRMAHPGRPQD
jgi:hypothetical protein